MTQKLLKVGSSAAVTIPKKSLKELGLKIGDEVRVEVDVEEKTVIIEPIKNISQELLSWTDKFIKQYRSALEALAKK
ncbi:MAG: AbrB/MazE/SpoVT family DNA-binding domain-containing protein [Patescibacteria group bacterium]